MEVKQQQPKRNRKPTNEATPEVVSSIEPQVTPVVEPKEPTKPTQRIERLPSGLVVVHQ